MSEPNQYKSCRGCGAEIYSKADTCKYCSAWQYSVIWKIIVVVILFIACIFILNNLPS